MMRKMSLLCFALLLILAFSSQALAVDGATGVSDRSDRMSPGEDTRGIDLPDLNNDGATMNRSDLNRNNMNRMNRDGVGRDLDMNRGITTNNLRTNATADNNAWGWLGILGLLGLAGMFGRNRSPER